MMYGSMLFGLNAICNKYPFTFQGSLIDLALLLGEYSNPMWRHGCRKFGTLALVQDDIHWIYEYVFFS